MRVGVGRLATAASPLCRVPWGPRQPSLNCLVDEPASSSFTGDEGRWLLEEEGDIQP